MTLVIAISDREEDIKFGQDVANAAQFEFAVARKQTELRAILKKQKDAVMLWDVDHPNAIDVTYPNSISNMGQVLRDMTTPERVFALSTNALNKSPFIFNMPVFGHHIYRQFNPPAALAVSTLFKNCTSATPFGLANYLPQGTPTRKVTLRKASERRFLVGAIENILTQHSVPNQLVSLLSQTTDELLMNCIFDAPMVGMGDYYRRKTPRDAEFDFKPREVVELEMGFAAEYFVIGARDQFGSLKKESILNFIRKDYEKTEYKVKENDPGAGLGIYGMLQAGLSVLFISRPNIKTEVLLIVPVVKNMKGFRNSFRFFSFI